MTPSPFCTFIVLALLANSLLAADPKADHRGTYYHCLD